MDMEQQLIRRVEIIMNSSPSTTKRKDTPAKEYRSAVRMRFISLISMLIALACVWQAGKVILNIEGNIADWNSSTMLINMSFILLLLTPRSLADFLLKRHMMTIIETKPTLDDNSNDRLKEAIALITDRKTNLQYSFLPMILLIGALLETMGLNPIWHLFAYIVPLCLIMIILRSVKNYNIITKCITDKK